MSRKEMIKWNFFLLIFQVMIRFIFSVICFKIKQVFWTFFFLLHERILNRFLKKRKLYSERELNNISIAIKSERKMMLHSLRLRRILKYQVTRWFLTLADDKGKRMTFHTREATTKITINSRTNNETRRIAFKLVN